MSKFKKYDEGKPKYSLIPTEVLSELAKALTYGEAKYSKDNWKYVDDKSRYVDALFRHLESWRAGDKVDNESGINHLTLALANISFLVYFDSANEGDKQ